LGNIPIKSPEELDRMRSAGRSLARVMNELEALIVPGAVTADLDRFAEERIRKLKARPAFKGYRGYPATLCISINEQVVHGIPGKHALKAGDLVGIDVGLILEGFYSDMARSFHVGGEPPEKVRKLMDTTRNALQSGIAKMREGNKLGDVSHAVQLEAESKGFSVVRALVGHGIGRAMHEDPQVPNYGHAGTGIAIKNGMVFAIEPMVNAGKYPVRFLEDGWTVITADGSLSCHFENTVAATAEGPEILTDGDKA